MVIDTNVLACANGDAPQAGRECVLACVLVLREIEASGIVCLDVGGAVLAEYSLHASPTGQPGVGDAFYRWLYLNKERRYRVRQVEIAAHARRGYEEFPSDSALESFDHDDRKFIAVAVVAGKRRRPPILNATDSDYSHYLNALQRHGVTVEELCPDILKPL